MKRPGLTQETVHGNLGLQKFLSQSMDYSEQLSFYGVEMFGGKTYFVDYEHGNDNNDGSMEFPVAQVDAAITLSNAFRISEVMDSSVGFFRRNRIYIRPWGATATGMGIYDPITVIPQHCDIVGLGATVLTGGSGIVAIGSVTDGTEALTVGVDGMRGVNFYNIQFQGGGSGTNTINATGTVMRCGWFNCSFYSLPDTVSHIATTGHWAGNTMKNCHFKHSAVGVTCLYNYTSTTGVQSDNLWEDCSFEYAQTANISIGSTTITHGSIMKHCSFGNRGDVTTDSFLDVSGDGGYFLLECWFNKDVNDPLQRTHDGNDAGCIKGKVLIEGTE